MKLILNREDLKPEHVNIDCSKTKFEHFQPAVQAMIIEVGKATFKDWYDGYNVILVPDSLLENQ